jgi:hypothetical protein
MSIINSQFLLYTGVIIIVIYLIIIGTLRIKMQFWRTQPVFHIYNLKYWIKPPGFINLEPPPVNKYVNLINNKLIPVDSIDGANNVKLKQICNFIKDYYVIHPGAKYKPSEEDIMAYLTCSNHPSFFNVYQEPQMLFDGGSTSPSPPLSPPTATSFSIINDQEIIGVSSIRALNITLLKGRKKKKITFPVYYVDNLCVKPGYRKKGIPPQMIQTFYYNVSRANRRVNAYMFKREGTLTAIMPLVYFDTYCFDISCFSIGYVLNPAMSLIEIGANQLNIFVAFIKEQQKQFECTVVPDVSSLLNLIKLEKLLIYGIIFNNELLAAYIFRPIELYQRGSARQHIQSSAEPLKPRLGQKTVTGKTIECIAIISNKDKDKDILITGFNMSLLKTITKCGASTLLVEETAHSPCVIKALNTNSTVFFKFKSPTAFFLYNYACYSIKNDKTLLIY